MAKNYRQTIHLTYLLTDADIYLHQLQNLAADITVLAAL